MELSEMYQKSNKIVDSLNEKSLEEESIIGKKIVAYMNNLSEIAYIIFEEGYFISYEGYDGCIEKMSNYDVVESLKDNDYMRKDFLKFELITQEQFDFLELYTKTKNQIYETERKQRQYKEYLKLKKEFEPEA